MENIGRQRVQTFDIRVPGSRAHNPIASLILILHYGKIKTEEDGTINPPLVRGTLLKELDQSIQKMKRKQRWVNSLHPISSSVLDVLSLLSNAERNAGFVYDHC